jgi:uncharacterized Rossmann fold enzyme
MIYSEWLPWYEEICTHFRFNPHDDFRSSLLLDDLAKIKSSSYSFRRQFIGKDIKVVGNGPNLSAILENAPRGTYFVADSALSVYYRTLGPPDVIVTDLDGDAVLIRKCQEEGSRLVIHAHGDNIENIREILPYINREVLCTTQNAPFGMIYNFGGFTDGDRAAYLADQAGASSITLTGFDFMHPTGKPGGDQVTKAEKLKYAERLLENLAVSRGKHLIRSDFIEI